MRMLTYVVVYATAIGTILKGFDKTANLAKMKI